MSCTKMKGFYRQKEGGMRKLKEWIISDKFTFPQSKARGWTTLLVLTGKFQTDLFKFHS